MPAGPATPGGLCDSLSVTALRKTGIFCLRDASVEVGTEVAEQLVRTMARYRDNLVKVDVEVEAEVEEPKGFIDSLLCGLVQVQTGPSGTL